MEGSRGQKESVLEPGRYFGVKIPKWTALSRAWLWTPRTSLWGLVGTEGIPNPPWRGSQTLLVPKPSSPSSPLCLHGVSHPNGVLLAHISELIKSLGAGMLPSSFFYSRFLAAAEGTWGSVTCPAWCL